MTLKERDQQRKIYNTIEILAPLIAEHGVGNILMAIASICSTSVKQGKKINPGLADKFDKADKLLTTIAKEIQLLGI